MEVELTAEIVENGVKRTETVLMDDKLEKSRNYSWTITTEDITKISLNTIDEIIKNIIEISLYTKVKG